ncbi:6873_t:CDS:2, partial [Diversispora eburnea]
MIRWTSVNSGELSQWERTEAKCVPTAWKLYTQCPNETDGRDGETRTTGTVPTERSTD